jgi:dual specificity MAP kinase phosphatase
MIAVSRRVAEVPTYTKRSPSPSDSVRKQTPKPFVAATTPPTSPRRDAFQQDKHAQALLGSPLGRYEQVAPQVFALSVIQLNEALAQEAKTPLPETKDMFPWLHGIHKDNWAQRDFFRWHDRADIAPPRSYRGITLVHAGRPTVGLLDGAISAEDLLSRTEDTFADIDAVNGVSLRNFHTQQVKCAMLSDIVLYTNSDAQEDVGIMLATAQRLVRAQYAFRMHWQGQSPTYNVFVIEDTFPVIERDTPHLVAVKRDGTQMPASRDFIQLEQLEMRQMSKASEFATNVFLGCDADWVEDSTPQADGKPPREQFSVRIKCEDYVAIPSIRNDEIRDSGDLNHAVRHMSYRSC